MVDILVVDDSAAVRNDVSEFLSSNGFTVKTAVHGQDGLEKMEMDSSIKLVITDVNMPKMDGLTFIEKVRGDLGNTSVQVIVLTADTDEAMKKRSKASGVKGWIIKPFKGSKALLGAIKTLVG